MLKSRLNIRTRTADAVIYRISEDPRVRRESYEQIGNIILYNKRIIPLEGETISEQEYTEIRNWIERYAATVEKINVHRAEQLVHEIGRVTDWIEREAGNEEFQAAFEPLILSIHDLRTTLIRRFNQMAQGSDPPRDPFLK